MIKEKIAILGRQGSGKSYWIDKILSNNQFPAGLDYLKGRRILSLTQEDQDRFLREEKKRDESDILQYQDMGTLVRDFLGEEYTENPQRWGDYLDLSDLLDRGISFLSTGERRKTFIMERLLQEPELLILENPFSGLDVQSHGQLKGFLAQCTIPILLFLSRSQDIPSNFNQGFILDQGEIKGPYHRDRLVERFTSLKRVITMDGPLPPPPTLRPPRIYPRSSSNLRKSTWPIMEILY